MCSLEERLSCGWINMASKWCQNLNVWPNSPFKHWERQTVLLAITRRLFIISPPLPQVYLSFWLKVFLAEFAGCGTEKNLWMYFGKKKHPQSSAKRKRGKKRTPDVIWIYVCNYLILITRRENERGKERGPLRHTYPLLLPSAFAKKCGVWCCCVCYLGVSFLLSFVSLSLPLLLKAIMSASPLQQTCDTSITLASPP